MSETGALMDAADGILTDPKLVGARWLRAASLLYRSALEDALAAFWRRRAPGVQTARFRSQLGCLWVYADPGFAREVWHTWESLSDMAHHQTVLGPDRETVRRAGVATRQVVGRLGELVGAPHSEEGR